MTITLTREEAQQALDALESVWLMDRTKKQRQTIEALRSRLAQPEPEPVAWMQNDMEHFSLWPDEWHVVPLYTAPPQRSSSATPSEWQGLTDEEIKKEQHRIDWTNAHTYAKFARAIEAKLKEKNT